MSEDVKEMCGILIDAFFGFFAKSDGLLGNKAEWMKGEEVHVA